MKKKLLLYMNTRQPIKPITTVLHKAQVITLFPEVNVVFSPVVPDFIRQLHYIWIFLQIIRI
jgi:hypothetical protein